ncbi:MAG: HD domain-containing protein [Nitrospirae bacterium]|nr:HD domain-containing protein [Nitrospirota bacterium]
MDELKLCRSVYVPDVVELLPEGTMLSADTLNSMISSKNAGLLQTYPMLDHGMIKKDLLRQIKRPPYDAIFSDQLKVEELLGAMQKVRLVEPVLQSMDYFKEHDYHTYCHILMVYALSTLIARDLMPDYEDWIQAVQAGPTHDIGKICVPLHILQKKTPLTKAEREILDHHTAAGYVLLGYFHQNTGDIGAMVARDHHERRDGSGRPLGRKLDNMMVEIVIACDVYDALVSPRPYRPECYDNRTALEEVTKMAEENKIHWEIVKALIAHNRKDKPSFCEAEVSTAKRGVPPRGNYYGVVED